MKKSKMLIFLLGLFFLCMSVVEAKDYIKYQWSLEQGTAANYLFYDHTIKTDDGYITASIDEEYAGVIRKISKDGKEIIWEYENYDGVFMALDQDDDYVYAVMLPTSEDKCITDDETYKNNYYCNKGGLIYNRYIFKISKSTGEQVSKVAFSTNDNTIYDVELYVEDNIYIITRSYDHEEIVNKATKLYTISKNLEVVKIEDYDNLSSSQKEEISGGYRSLIDDSIYKIYQSIEFPKEFNDVNFKDTLFAKDHYYSKGCDVDGSLLECEVELEYKNKKEYYIGTLFISNSYWTKDYTYAVGEADFYISDQYYYYYDDDFDFVDYYSFILKINNETGEVEWIKDAPDDYMYYDVVGISDDFVITVGYQDDNWTEVGYERDSESVVSSLFIYDLDGNIVEEHDLAKEAGVSRVDITHIMPFGKTIVGQAFAYDEDDNMTSLVFKYAGKFNIGINVEGNGTVNVPEEAFPGDEVEVVLTPDFGWTVDSIIVRDADGNEIEVNDNKFIMPDSDVTIEVKFKKIVEEIIENPNTAAISITGLVLLAGGLGFIVNKNYKKLKFLK